MNFKESSNTENYLYPTAFKFSASKIPGVTYHCQSANIPGVSIGMVPINSPKSGRTAKIPSQNLEYQDLSIKFLVDENMSNWLEIYNWVLSMRVVEDWSLVKNLSQRTAPIVANDVQLTDASMVVLTSSNNPVKIFQFHNMFPRELSSVEFNSGSDGREPLTATATFSFEYYTVETP